MIERLRGLRRRGLGAGWLLAASLVAPPLAVAGGPGSAATGLANSLVNDPALDVGSHDSQSEAASITAGAGRVVAVYSDSGSFDGTNDHLLGWSTSTDGGVTFVDRGTLPDDPGGLGDWGGATLARDELTGDLYLACYSYQDPRTILVFRSIDGGERFEPPVPVFDVTEDQEMDRPWIAVDAVPGPAPSYVYVAARMFDDLTGGGMRLAYSTDGGLTFTSGPGQLLNDPGYTANLVIGPDHELHLFWWEWGWLVLRTSLDHGATFGPRHRVAQLSSGYYGELGLEFDSFSFPQAVADPNDGEHLIVVYADTGSGADRADVLITQSNDGGITWSVPARVGTDAESKDQFGPTIAITPDGERLFVGWYDRRRDPRNWEIEYWGRVGKVADGAVDFGNDFPVSSSPFPPVYGQDSFVLSRHMGNYDQATSDGDFFYVTWGDNRLDNAWHANQPDVRFAKIPRDGPGPLLEARGAAFVAGDCDVENDGAEPGETVLFSLCLENVGTAPTVELVGALEASGGVTDPGPPQSFGALAPNAGSACRDFQFTVDPTLACGADLVPALELTDLGESHGTARFELAAGDSGIATYGPYVNPEPILLGNGPAVPYPSTLSIPDAPASVDNAVVSLFGFSHTTPEAVNMLLVAPSGNALLFFADAGGFQEVQGLDLGFSDSALVRLSSENGLSSGTFLPSDDYGGCFEFPPPAPPNPPACAPPEGLATLSSALLAGDARGTWRLFEWEGLSPELGELSGGWSLTLSKEAFSCRCGGPFFAGDFEVGDSSQWSQTVSRPDAH